MNEIKWNDRFNIGVQSIDQAHQRLFAIANKLISLNEDAAKQQHACREGLKYLKSYTLKHFADEEAYMRSIDYSEYAIHKSLHDNMRVNTIPALEKELEAQDYSVESIQHFLGICIGWLNGHIMIEDHAITGKTKNKWVHQPDENELSSLKTAITQSFGNLFRVDLQLVSEHYSGEDFAGGNTLCYRLSYLSQDKKRLHVYLIYEERLILNVLSDTLGRPIRTVDQTVIYALKVLSEKFMTCISQQMAVTPGQELTKMDLLSFEQIDRMFAMEKQYPAYSLLFNNETNGYFAFCVKS